MPHDIKKLEQFYDDKREALSSLDREKIIAYAEKYNMQFFLALKDDEELFWGSVHKAITGVGSLPIEFRRESKKYLDSRGLRSLDDGEL